MHPLDYMDTWSRLLTATAQVPLIVGIAAIIGTAGTVYLVLHAIYNIYFHHLSCFPGPTSRAASYVPYYFYLLLGRDTSKTKALHDQYGSVVRIAPNDLSFSSPGAYKDIYGSSTQRGQLEKDQRFYLGDPCNIMSASNTDHARMRKTIAHAFSETALRQQEPIFSNYFRDLMMGLQRQVEGPSQGKVDLCKWLNFTTFDVMGDLTFGESFHALQNEASHVWVENIFRATKITALLKLGMHYPLVRWIGKLITLVTPAIGNAYVEHQQFSARRADERMFRGVDRKDFMHYILRHKDERGMSRNEIHATCSTLIIGGSETTATLLSGACYYLMTNPEAMRTLRSEIRAAFRDESDISMASTNDLRYLQAVLDESLRIYPPVPTMLPRITTQQGNFIDGHYVAGNTYVGIYDWSVFHSAENFADPELFVPERWLPERPKRYASDNREALQPFSVGPRACIGRNLAYVEMRCLLSRLLFNFDIELCNESERWNEQRVFTLWDKPPLMVRLSRRSD